MALVGHRVPCELKQVNILPVAGLCTQCGVLNDSVALWWRTWSGGGPRVVDRAGA